MKKSIILQGNKYKQLASIWLVFCLISLGLSIALIPRMPINSSVLALLPENTLGDVPQGIEDAFLTRLDSQMIWLVHDDKNGMAAAQAFADGLKQIGRIDVKDKMSASDLSAWGEYYFQHRDLLLDDATKNRLTGDGQQQANWILSQLYSAFSGISSKELTHDPLLLMRAKQLELQSSAKKMMLQQGWLYTKDEQGASWYIIRGELQSSYTMATAHQIVEDIDGIKNTLQKEYPDSQILQRGTLFYSDYASQLAQKDMTHLGSTTLLAVIALIIVAFRSLRPLLLCLLSVAVGGMVGMLVTYLVFGEVHLMTLVMSMSLIGLSVDYALYFLTERMVHGKEDTPFATINKIRTTLLQALMTVIIAYVVMMVAPFPGLRQLAVFAAVGLTASCLTVMLFLPFLVNKLPVRPLPCQRILSLWINLWTKNSVFPVAIIVLITILIAASFWHLRVSDDIGELQALPAHLQQQDQTITKLTGQSTEQKWFVVYGQHSQQALERVEKLNAVLVQAKEQGLLSDYRTFPLPSLKQQSANQLLVAQAMPKVVALLADQGVALSVDTLSSEKVTPEQWLKSTVSEGWRLAYVSLADGATGILIPVNGVTDTSKLSELAGPLEGVAWVDRKTQFSDLFAFYRTILTGLLLIILGVIVVFYCARLGMKKGVIYVMPTILSLGGALAFLVYSGQSLNLFSLLALVLVLGIGINYTLFFGNERGVAKTSLLAITLAMLTTLWTQGLLVFSATQAIRGFGIVLCGGIVTAFILSPLVLTIRNEK